LAGKKNYVLTALVVLTVNSLNKNNLNSITVIMKQIFFFNKMSLILFV